MRPLVDRLVEVLKKNPEIENHALKERFGVSAATINIARQRAGVPEPLDIDNRRIRTPERWPVAWNKDGG